MYFEGLFLTLVCAAALIGNICMWIIICKSKELRTTTNAFILGLVTADLLVSAANMPVTLSSIYFGDWALSEDACVVFGFSNMLTLVLSVMSLCNISINRYVMVCKPIYFKTLYTRRNASLMIAFCVFISLALSSPPLFGWAEYAFIKEQSFCFCNWRKNPSYAFFMIGCCFGIPFSVMTVCNIFIYKTVRASKRRIAGAKISNNSITTVAPAPTSMQVEVSTVSSSQSEKTQLFPKQSIANRKVTIGQLSTVQDISIEVSSINQENKNFSFFRKSRSEKKMIKIQKEKSRSEEIRLALALAIVVVMFVVCWLPFCVSMLIGIFNQHAVNDSFHLWTLLIGYSNSCMNPVIYGIMNKKFGEGFKDIFCRFCRR